MTRLDEVNNGSFEIRIHMVDYGLCLELGIKNTNIYMLIKL